MPLSNLNVLFRSEISQCRLPPLLIGGHANLFDRFAASYRALNDLPRQQKRRYLRKMNLSLSGMAFSLALGVGDVGFNNASAATIPVGGGCTLADAIGAANSDSAVGGCVAGSGADTIVLGGGVYSSGTQLEVDTEISIEGNGSTLQGSLGVRGWLGGDLTVADATITQSRVTSGSLLLRNVVVTGSPGDGIAASGASVTLLDSTVAGSSEAGIKAFTSDIIIHNSTISGNGEEGIFNDAFEFGDLAKTEVVNSTISGNTGAGIRVSNAYGSTDTKLVNSTISGSGSTGLSGSGGSAYSGGDQIEISNSIISGNAVSIGSEVSVTNVNVTTDNNVFGHSLLTTAQALSGVLPSVSDITATSNGTLPTALSAILDTNLTHNGGPTETHGLVVGSPAVDSVATGPAADQRGISRPQGASYDIGAYELQPLITTCNGLPVTVDFNLGQTTTPADDVVLGTPGADIIRGKAGNDTICGMGGDDYIHGNSGDDWIDGGDGVDNLRGGRGSDTIYTGIGATVGTSSRAFGGYDDDFIYGGTDNDDLRGGRGVDTIEGNEGNDSISGNEGDDLIYGDGGNDVLKGGNGESDKLFGGAGDDSLNGGAGASDLCDGGGDAGDTFANCEL